jgi:hypothetical protein
MRARLTAARPDHDSTTRCPLPYPSKWEPSMSRYAVHLAFTLAAIWVVVIFMLVSNTTN